MNVSAHILLLAGAWIGLGGEVASAAPALTEVSSADRRRPFFPADYKLQALLKSLVEQKQAKGIVLGLLEPDGTRRTISYGDAGAGAQTLSAQSVFELGSVTKTFTAAILADMVRRGEVSLDDPVAKYLPSEVRVPSRGGRQITLLDLATHRSGLPPLPTGFRPPNRSNPFADYQVEHLNEFLSRYELERDIGSEAIYSNLGMGLLGHALTRAAGAESFPALVKQRIADPLGLKMTGFGRPPDMGKWMARGHNRKGEEVPYWDMAILAGAGGLNANLEDMLAYLDANAGPPKTALEKAMRDTHGLRGPLWDKEDWAVGLGWQRRTVDGRSIINHGGETAGFVTYLAFDPVSGAGVVVLGNSAAFDAANDIAFGLLRGAALADLRT